MLGVYPQKRQVPHDTNDEERVGSVPSEKAISPHDANDDDLPENPVIDGKCNSDVDMASLSSAS